MHIKKNTPLTLVQRPSKTRAGRDLRALGLVGLVLLRAGGHILPGLVPAALVLQPSGARAVSSVPRPANREKLLSIQGHSSLGAVREYFALHKGTWAFGEVPKTFRCARITRGYKCNSK